MDCSECCRLLLGSGWGEFKGNPSSLVWILLESWFSTHEHKERHEAGAVSVHAPEGGLDLTATKRVGMAMPADLSLGKQSRKHSLPKAADVQPYPSSFFCTMKHWWPFSHSLSPFRVATTVFKTHE